MSSPQPSSTEMNEATKLYFDVKCPQKALCEKLRDLLDDAVCPDGSVSLSGRRSVYFSCGVKENINYCLEKQELKRGE